jgi:hypothetical protein
MGSIDVVSISDYGKGFLSTSLIQCFTSEFFNIAPFLN